MKIVTASLCAMLLAGGCRQAETAEKIVQDNEAPQAEDVSPLQQETSRTVHVFVALCDNKSQGIVPVPAVLGNGDDPRNNLYWGAMYGTKTFFKKSPVWSLVAEEEDPKENVLQRVIFKDSKGGGYLVADAYRGASIKQATLAFLNAAAGNDARTHKIEGDVLGLNGAADLVVYVGHNGLMDFGIQQIEFEDAQTDREAIVLACKSEPYFRPLLSRFGCRSILLTTGFMAPEGYTLEAAVNAWIDREDGPAIKEVAARAYHKYQKCGLNGARRLFFSE